MNEEELKKGCGEQYLVEDDEEEEWELMCGKHIWKDENTVFQYHLCPTCQAKLDSFQKGKLEQKKEELGFLILLNTQLQRIWKIWGFKKEDEVTKRIKQLSKEIGDNSQEQGLKPRNSTPRSNKKSVYADNPTLDTQDLCIKCGKTKEEHFGRYCYYEGGLNKFTPKEIGGMK